MASRGEFSISLHTKAVFFTELGRTAEVDTRVSALLFIHLMLSFISNGRKTIASGNANRKSRRHYF